MSRDSSWDGAAQYDERYFATGLGEAYHRDNPNWAAFFGRVADFIVSEFAPETVLDAGCAIGFLVEALRERGVDARGFDVSEYAISQVPEALKPYCVLGSVTDEMDGSYDLITCIEVLEHLPADVAERAIDNLTRHTDRVLFSSSPDDVREPTHVNVQQPDEWVRAFAARGFFPRATTKALALSPQAIVFERRQPALADEVGAYERVRYRLAAAMQAAQHEEAARTLELEVASEKLKAAAERIRALESRRADAEAAAAELEVLRATTWWRIGRPIRGAVSLVRTRVPTGRRRVPLVGAAVGQSTSRIRSLMIGVGRRTPLPVRRALWRRFPAAVEGLFQLAPAASSSTSVDELVARRFPLLRPLAVFPVPKDGGRHLTVVTDSLSPGSLFGGVGTSMILATMLARRLDASLRVVTRTERPEPSSFKTVLRAHEVDWEQNLEFSYAPLESGGSSLPYRSGEVFLTTSWWSTWAALRSVDPARIVYLLQEDERLFYPAGDEQVACSEVLADPRIRFAINTSMLHDYLMAEGFENLAENGVSFEPAFPESMYFHQARSATERRRFFFYARPNNVRNLFWRGLEAVKEAVVQGVLDPDAWDLHFVGSGVPPVTLPRGATPIISENLPWPEYAALIRRVDVGLSLMSTPHPSYPPLDLAACGAVAVTNRFGPKQSLDRYSANIVCADLSRDALVDGIATAVALAEDEPQRTLNYRNQRLSRSWQASLEPLVEQLIEGL